MRPLFIAASLVASATAFAQPAANFAADFAALDRNGDGYLSRLEAAAAPEIAKRFAQFDIDKDRRLSLPEYLAARADNAECARRDAALTARVKAALTAERGIYSSAISVETYEGQVMLSGFVPAADMASRAGRITAGLNGVRSVHNNLLVKSR